jgi:hypothetical protein
LVKTGFVRGILISVWATVDIWGVVVDVEKIVENK